jgi:hypothetical protein
MFEDFTEHLDTRWKQTCIGGGSIAIAESCLRMSFEAAQRGQYTDAQIDDYGSLRRAKFPWEPPVRLQVRARASLPAATPANASGEANFLRGTAGFGFWNYPFSVRGDILMLPEAVWFFYASPPSNMALVPGKPGFGWKAQVVHCMRPAAFFSALPLAATAILGRINGETRSAARWMQRVTGAQEAVLDSDMTGWHIYALDWYPDAATFRVDGELVLRAPGPPTRPLGFVAWLDNQFAIATPRGDFHFGTLNCGPQWMELDSVKIEAL